MRKLATASILAALLTSGAAFAQQKLDGGEKPARVTMVSIDRPFRSLPQLAQDADVIVLSTVTALEQVQSNRQSVSTRYTLRVLKTFKPSHNGKLLDGTDVNVLRWGGKIQTETGVTQFFESGFPMFDVGETYLLFLCVPKSSSTDLEICSGPQGTWRFRNSRVEPVEPSSETGSQARPMNAVTRVVQRAYYSGVATPLSLADISAMLEGELDQSEIAEFVRKTGVEFSLTSETENDLVSRGAKPELLQAIAANGK